MGQPRNRVQHGPALCLALHSVLHLPKSTGISLENKQSRELKRSLIYSPDTSKRVLRWLIPGRVPVPRSAWAAPPLQGQQRGLALLPSWRRLDISLGLFWERDVLGRRAGCDPLPSCAPGEAMRRNLPVRHPCAGPVLRSQPFPPGKGAAGQPHVLWLRHVGLGSVSALKAGLREAQRNG